jgi:Flp pilus assembly protein TadB
MTPSRIVTRWRRTDRRLTLRPESVAAWCDDVARRVRSGESLLAALRDTPIGDPALRISTEPIRHALDRGATVSEAVASAATTAGTGAATIGRSMRGAQHLALACAVISVAATGGSAAAPLDRVAAALRLRAVDRDDRATQAAQARMSAHVLTLVPLVMLGLLSVADADVRAAVVSGAGIVCVGLGVVLNGCGWLWMRHTIGEPR